MTALDRGRLRHPHDAPDTGERVDRLAHLHHVVVEQILSGELAEPVDYLEDHDEWVVVLAGAADLEADGQRLHLDAGDWVVLPAGTPHRLLATNRGTSWLAVTAPGRDQGTA